MKILAISDQHGRLPAIPECDLLIVAGDLCPDGFGGRWARDYPQLQLAWFKQDWMAWRQRQPARWCLVTWGNHDYCGEIFRRDARVAKVGAAAGKWTVVACDELVEVPELGLRVYLTPWSDQFMKWAFMRSPAELQRVYDRIPRGVDILVSHQPPRGAGGRATLIGLNGRTTIEELGSVELQDAVRRTRPRSVVCGHVHSGHGTYDLDGIPVYNVSVVDEGYRLVNPATEITPRAK